MRGAVSRPIFTRCVVVSLIVSSAFIGAVVLAGALFRHHDPPRHPRPPVPAVTSAR